MNYVYSVSFSGGALFSSFKKAKQRVDEIVHDFGLTIVKEEHRKHSSYYDCRDEIACIRKDLEIQKILVY